MDPLRLRGRSVLRVSANDFLRPASLRFEHGRTDPDSYFEDWLDLNGLAREVLDPADPAGSGSVLPSLWNADTDRASRVSYVEVPANGIVLLDGALLLGRWLPFDFTVHLDMSPAALRRRTPDDDHWTLPAFDRYRDEVEPATVADVVVKFDDPQHPAIIEP
ncbi:uridine kinase [Kutzneria sp. 744]|uniref:uridine kinase n=1 Tax=Kutzneria sp. (strain 744) TaxID=345341 RepID=UPI001E3990CC|nr:uridine kinase [Kutzneria sp. 744]